MHKIMGAISSAGFGRMSAKEYQANINGLNIFFGAVLGFVLAGTENLSDLQFGLVLFVLATVVITILFISSSRSRILYSALAIGMATAFPVIVDVLLDGHGVVPGKIRPTLLVWTLMTIVVEFLPRERALKAQE